MIFCREVLRSVHYVRAVLVIMLTALLICALVIAEAEGKGFGEALYFTLITGLTVGYGDIVPATVLGRVFSVLAGVIGVIYIGMVVAIATRALGTVAQHRREREEKMRDGGHR